MKLSGAERWRDVAEWLELVNQLHGNIRQTEPQFRFAVITADPDDNKSAIAPSRRKQILS